MAKFDGAEKVYKEAEVQYRNTSQMLDVAKTQYCLSRVLLTQSKYEEAEKLLQQCLQVSALLRKRQFSFVVVCTRSHGDAFVCACISAFCALQRIVLVFFFGFVEFVAKYYASMFRDPQKTFRRRC